MIEIIKQLLFNLAILIVLTFFLQTFQSKNYALPSKTLVFLFFSFSVFASLMLSHKLNGEIRFDIRQVPLIVGALYMGPFHGFLLLMWLMVIRSFFGINDGFWISLFVYGLQVIAAWGMNNWFKTHKMERKIEGAMLLSLFSSIGFMILMYFVDHRMGATEWIIYIIASATGVGMMTYIIESEKITLYLKKQAVKSEKMEAVSQMSASISHEVRNPLATVKGFLQLMKEPDFTEQKRVEFIDIALMELDRAEKIITDYLSFAKPSNDKVEEITLRQELEHVVNVVLPLANMNSVVVKLSLEENLIILGDRHQLHQCLLNILKNSIEAMDGGGELSLLAYQEGCDAVIHINDSGIGMTEEQLQQIGEPYFTTKGKKGTGLGLMVSIAIINALKGTIKVDSKKNLGTTFVLTFPLFQLNPALLEVTP